MHAYGTIFQILSLLYKIYSARLSVGVRHHESFGSCEL